MQSIRYKNAGGAGPSYSSLTVRPTNTSPDRIQLAVTTGRNYELTISLNAEQAQKLIDQLDEFVRENPAPAVVSLIEVL